MAVGLVSSHTRGRGKIDPLSILDNIYLLFIVEIVLRLPKQETSRQHQRTGQDGTEDRTGANAQKH